MFWNALSYPRSYLMTAFAGLHTMVCAALVLLCAVVLRSRGLAAWGIRYIWARPIAFMNGFSVEVRGLENLPAGPKGYLILFNHTSLVDIIALYGYFPKFFNFGAKIELFKVPVFGPAMRAVGTLPIDRGDRKKVMRIYDEAIERVESGDIFALAPEGTRQDEPHLGRFKRGPFEFAVNARMDLLPVIVAGAIAVLPKNSLLLNRGRWRRRIVLQICPPVSTQGVKEDQLDQLQTRVREEMAPIYEVLNRELGVIASPEPPGFSRPLR